MQYLVYRAERILYLSVLNYSVVTSAYIVGLYAVAWLHPCDTRLLLLSWSVFNRCNISSSCKITEPSLVLTLETIDNDGAVFTPQRAAEDRRRRLNLLALLLLIYVTARRGTVTILIL